MDILNQIISSLNKEEVRHYKLYSNRTSTEGDRKDLMLFDFIRKSKDHYDEGKIFSKLYDADDKNPFYRLKNRLLNDLNKSLVMQHVDSDDNIYIFHLLSLTRYFQNRNNFKIAFHYIRKAEKKAIKLENYELLDVIYSELIKLSHEIVSINPEEYIHKRKENRDKLNYLRDIDDILAAVIYRIKISQNFSSSRNPIFELLQKTVDDFALNPKIKQNPKLRFTLYHAVSRILLSRREYDTLEEYLLTTYQEFSKEELFNKSNHDTKLQMLVYIVNTLFKNAKYVQSLEYTELLHTAMAEFNNLHFKKYLFYYYNSLVINYSQTDFPKAIPILEQLAADKIFKDTPYYDFFVLANLSISYFHAHEFSKAKKTLVKVFIHDGYKNTSEAFRMRFSIYELVLRLETDEFDFVEKRIEKVRKEFAEMLHDPANKTETELIQLIDQMNKAGELMIDKSLEKQINAFIQSKEPRELEDFSFIDYKEWLSEKMTTVS